MSADNMIYIQYRKGKWFVWMGFASDSRKPHPRNNSPFFDTAQEARAFARGWEYGESVVEYGVIELNPLGNLTPSPRDGATESAIELHCPGCGAVIDCEIRQTPRP